MPNMPSETQKDLLTLSEERIRTEGPTFDFEGLDPYWRDLLLVLSWHKAHRLEDNDMQKRAIDCISEPAYQDLLANWANPLVLDGTNKAERATL